MHQFVRGLSDPQAQERILESAAAVEGGQLSLTRVLKIAEAHEMGKSSQSYVNSGAQVSCLSEYQAKKRTSRQETRKKDDKPKDKDAKQCGNCGKTGHSSKLNDRRDNCPAFDKTCSKCDTNGHFPHMCRGGPKQTRNDRSKSKSKTSTVNEVKSKPDTKSEDKPNDDNANLGTLSGSWFLINGLQQPAADADFNEVHEVFTSARHEKAQLRALSGNRRKN